MGFVKEDFLYGRNNEKIWITEKILFDKFLLQFKDSITGGVTQES